MKMRFLKFFIEKLFKVYKGDDVERADMYLPIYIAVLGFLMISGGLILFGYTFIEKYATTAYFGAILIVLGTLAIMCWKNQTAEMLNDEEFVYTTFLGNSYTLRFDDILALRANHDSMTLILKDRKVHIESSAIISDRFAQAINKKIERL